MQAMSIISAVFSVMLFAGVANAGPNCGSHQQNVQNNNQAVNSSMFIKKDKKAWSKNDAQAKESCDCGGECDGSCSASCKADCQKK